MPNIQLQFRRGTASQWVSANPVLASGEMGIETDTNLFKIGDGTTAWNSLAYGGLQGPTGAAAGGFAGGTNTTVQFNASSSLTGATGFVFNSASTRVGIGVSSPAGVLDVCGSGTNPVYLQAPVYSRIALQDISQTNSVTVSTGSSGLHYNITISTFSNITLPATTTTAQGGIFWLFRNNSGNILAPNITNNANLPSNVSIPTGNSLTIAISSNAENTFVAF